MGALENRRREEWERGGGHGRDTGKERVGDGSFKKVGIFSHASLFTIFFSPTFLVHQFLFSLIEPFTTINSASHLFNFQYSDQTIFLRQTSRVDHHTRLKLHNSQPDPPQIRPPNPSTTPDHPQTRQPSDHQIRPSPPYQTTRSDHPNRQRSLTTQFQISTAQPVSWNGTG